MTLLNQSSAGPVSSVHRTALKPARSSAMRVSPLLSRKLVEASCATTPRTEAYGFDVWMKDQVSLNPHDNKGFLIATSVR
jgi:hypothetical protein